MLARIAAAAAALSLVFAPLAAGGGPGRPDSKINVKNNTTTLNPSARLAVIARVVFGPEAAVAECIAQAESTSGARLGERDEPRPVADQLPLPSQDHRVVSGRAVAAHARLVVETPGSRYASRGARTARSTGAPGRLIPSAASSTIRPRCEPRGGAPPLGSRRLTAATLDSHPVTTPARSVRAQRAQ